MTYAIKRALSTGVAAVLLGAAALSALAQDSTQTPVPMPQVDEARAAALAQGQARANQERYRFGLEDRIEVTVFRRPELSGIFDVAADGTIRFPRIDAPVVAVCRTERELSQELTEKLSKYLRQPFVQVRAAEQKSQSFAVIGAVTKPGVIFSSRRVNLLELLASVGGPNDKAGRRIVVARNGSASACRQNLEALNQSASSGNPDIETLEYDLNDIQAGKTAPPWLQPGDVVSVLVADEVYVVGNVNKPQPVALKKEMTLMQAIASAEGLKPSTKKGNIRILRQKPDSLERQEIVVDLRRVEKLEVVDPVLQPNDIVAVSEDGVKALTKEIIRGMMGGLASIPYVLRF